MSATSAPPTTTDLNLPTRLNLGPLTTTFTPPSECSTIAVGNNDNGILSFGLGETCSASTKVVDNKSCWPPINVNIGPLNLNVNGNLNGLGLYSPGLFCPVGYTTACTKQLNGLGTDIPLPSGGVTGSFQFDLVPSETAVGCCPSGYTCGANPSGAQTCVSQASTPVTAATCSANTFNLQTFQLPLAENITSDGHATITTMSAATAYAPLIQLNWQSSDGGGFNLFGCTARRTQVKLAGRIVASVIGGWVGGMMSMGMMMMMMKWCRRRHNARKQNFQPYVKETHFETGKEQEHTAML